MNNKGKIIEFERTGEFYSKWGLKLLNNQRFLEAADSFRKAVLLEPDNCEHYFNLSGVLSEMGSIKESINILENAVTSLNFVIPECYFAMGCNYFDLGNFKKSRENFSKYCENAPEGNLVMDAIEAIRFIDINILNIHKGRQAKIKKMADKGKELLDKCEFSKAIDVLKKAIEMDEGAVIPRINLSLAYYLQGEVGNAINIARGVLKIDKDNSYANSNLALFYKTIDSCDLCKRQVKVLKKCRFESVEEILNTVDILSKLDEDAAIKTILERTVNKYNEIVLWHFLAISHHNTRRYSKAIEIWNFIKVKMPHMSIFTDCFVLESIKCIKNPLSVNSIGYDIKVLSDYLNRIKELIDAFIKMEQDEFNKIWADNESVRDMINHFLYRLENKKKIKLINKLANIGDQKSIQILDMYAENSGRKDEISSKCEEIVMRSKVAGDAMVNVIKFTNIQKRL